MAVQTNVFMLLITVAFAMLSTATSVRDLPTPAVSPSEYNPRAPDLAARLAHATEGETNDCWTALSQLRQCSNEVIAFFLNGQTDIDTPCCKAVEFVTSQCWPSMLGVLGFTSEEGNLLVGYCNKTDGPAGAPLLVTDAATDHF